MHLQHDVALGLMAHQMHDLADAMCYMQDCGVAYGLKLKHNANLRLDLEVYVVFDSPQPIESSREVQPAGMISLPGNLRHPSGFRWPPVTRSDCQKGCDVSCHMPNPTTPSRLEPCALDLSSNGKALRILFEQ